MTRKPTQIKIDISYHNGSFVDLENVISKHGEGEWPRKPETRNLDCLFAITFLFFLLGWI